MHRKRQAEQAGFGLVTAIFVIVILALFGILAARYVTLTSISASEDYLAAQALYSAESAARLKIMCFDKGGGPPFYGAGNTCKSFNPTISMLTTSGTYSTAGTYSTTGTYRRIIVTADWQQEISREIEVNYRF